MHALSLTMGLPRNLPITKALVPASSLSDLRPPILRHCWMNCSMNDWMDAAIVTLPISDVNLRVEIVERESGSSFAFPPIIPSRSRRLVPPISPGTLLFSAVPSGWRPEASAQLLNCSPNLVFQSEEHPLSSHPQEMQEGIGTAGAALFREGTPLIEGLTSRPIIGVDWTVDTAVVFKRD